MTVESTSLPDSSFNRNSNSFLWRIHENNIQAKARALIKKTV